MKPTSNTNSRLQIHFIIFCACDTFNPHDLVCIMYTVCTLSNKIYSFQPQQHEKGSLKCYLSALCDSELINYHKVFPSYFPIGTDTPEHIQENHLRRIDKRKKKALCKEGVPEKLMEHTYSSFVQAKFAFPTQRNVRRDPFNLTLK